MDLINRIKELQNNNLVMRSIANEIKLMAGDMVFQFDSSKYQDGTMLLSPYTNKLYTVSNGRFYELK